MELALKAIAEPHRREILRLLLNKELSSGEIAQRFPVTRPAISQHLRVLLDAGLLEVERRGTRRFYRARPEGLAELRQYMQEFWADSLRLLAEAAEAEEREQRRKEQSP